MEHVNAHPPPTHKRWSEFDIHGLPKSIKGSGCTPRFPQPLAAPTSSLLPPKLQAWCHYYPFFITTRPIIMFSKVTLVFIAIGALSVNALVVPVARSPVPESECESPRSFSTIPYRDLTFVGLEKVFARGDWEKNVKKLTGRSPESESSDHSLPYSITI